MPDKPRHRRDRATRCPPLAAVPLALLLALPLGWSAPAAAQPRWGDSPPDTASVRIDPRMDFQSAPCDYALPHILTWSWGNFVPDRRPEALAGLAGDASTGDRATRQWQCSSLFLVPYNAARSRQAATESQINAAIAGIQAQIGTETSAGAADSAAAAAARSARAALPLCPTPP